MSTNLLVILDGWGYSENKNYNAAAQANTPNFDFLFANYPHTLIDASGASVGLPDGQVGNSEVGHVNLGAGRVVKQQFVAINDAIADKSFYKNQHLLNFLANKSRLHVICMLSSGGIHSHQNHLYATCKLAVELGISDICIHIILDGRDVPPKGATKYIQALEQELARIGAGKICSVIGRFYAMDRDKRWERIQAAYDLFVSGKANFNFDLALDAVEAAYARNETDEFIQASSIGEPTSIHEQDAIFLVNFRPDRMIQLTDALYSADFTSFPRSNKPFANILSMTEYRADFKHLALFKTEPVTNTLGEYIGNLGLKQLRIAETEKYAHVTFFFNGGREEKFINEDRYLVNSPKVKTYDMQPQMSAADITQHLLKVIATDTYDLIICNYANGDMVGHTGQMDAAMLAMETLDTQIGKLLVAIEKNGGQCLITADHGNVEKMFDEDTNQPCTSHTNNLVPLIYYGKSNIKLKTNGKLSDVAPTILELMGYDKPVEMLGTSLIKK